jgi:hypothetical protein
MVIVGVWHNENVKGTIFIQTLCSFKLNVLPGAARTFRKNRPALLSIWGGVIITDQIKAYTILYKRPQKLNSLHMGNIFPSFPERILCNCFCEL